MTHYTPKAHTSQRGLSVRPNVLWTTNLRRFARRLSPNTEGSDSAKVLMNFDFPPVDCTCIQY